MGSGMEGGETVYLQEDPLLSSGAAAMSITITTTISAVSPAATSLGPGLGIAIAQTTWHLQQSHTFPPQVVSQLLRVHFVCPTIGPWGMQ